MYIYEGHLGTLYTSEYELDFEDLYCEQCGDYDELLGYAETAGEAWELLKNDWVHGYVLEFIHSNFDENFEIK